MPPNNGSKWHYVYAFPLLLICWTLGIAGFLAVMALQLLLLLCSLPAIILGALCGGFTKKGHW